MDPRVTAEICQQQGDSACEKRQYSEAIKHYIKTIGYLEPSYVITRFKDPQHAEHLVKYLEALNKHGLETKQHTTLRFNCYTKLRSDQKLKDEVEACIVAAREKREPSFDLETAVQVLVLAGSKVYKDHALALAQAHHLHSFYTKMLSETHDYALILDYLRDVETKIARDILQTYGNDMMIAFHQLADGTLECFLDFLVRACTEGLKARPDSDDQERLNPDDIARVFLTFPVDHYKVLESYVRFLETEGELDKVSKDVWNTIIELATTLLHEDDAKTWFEKGRGKFDSEQLLLFFRAEKARFGILLVYDFLGYYQEIFKISSNREIPDVCVRYGRRDPDLWRLGLDRLCRSRDPDNLVRLIAAITENDAMPVLAVISICLKAGPFATLGLIRQAVETTFRRQQETIAQLQAQYREVEAEVTKWEDLCQDLTYQHFIAKASKCAGCKQAIDLPAKHFFCGHSFHMACLGDDLTKCPVCKGTQEKTVQLKVESYRAGRKRLKKNIDPAEKYRFKLLDHLNAEDYQLQGAAEKEPDTFARLCECLAGDLLNPDEDKEKLLEAKKLHAEYTQH
jgi:hypothetical protein